MKPDVGRSSDYALVLFTFLWTCAELFHRICFARFSSLIEWLAIPILAAAGVTLLRPRSIAAFAALCGLSALHTFLKVPIANHMTFGGVTNLVLFLILIRHRLQDRQTLWVEISSALRIFVYILYFFAVLHKINADYMDPSSSCGTYFWDTIRERLPFLPGGAGVRQFSIYGSLAAEALILISLFIPSLRFYGILFGLAFHTLLLAADSGSYCLYSFSSLVIAAYAVFLDPSCWERAKSRLYRFEALLCSRIPGFRNLKHPVMAVSGFLTFICTISFLFFLWSGRPESRYYQDSYTRLGLVAWTLYAAGAAIFFVAALAGRRPASQESFGRAKCFPWPALLGGVLLVFYGLNPYIGLRTTSSFAMFSNLRTEHNWNHLFMPQTMKVFKYQDDLVEILRSTDSKLQNFADKKMLLPYLELQRTASLASEPFMVEYIRGGERHVLEGPPPRPGHFLSNWFYRKFMRFREVSKEGSMPCVH